MAHTTVEKTLNRFKALVEKHEGPAETDQTALAIADAMRCYWENDRLSFCIPAHAGGRGPVPEFMQWAGMDAAPFDLPMSHGVDTRDRAWQVQSTAQQLFTDAVGPKQTLLPTTGCATSGRSTLELADHRRLMPLLTFAHGEAEVDRLVRALRDLVDRCGRAGKDPDIGELPSRPDLRAQQRMLPRDAFFAPSELLATSDAVGRVAAELVTPYPPGVPVVAPGEVYNDAIVQYLQEFVAAGGFVEGAADSTLSKLRVVA
jgi:arginine/lysine/ornithine decarboxylase